MAWTVREYRTGHQFKRHSESHANPKKITISPQALLKTCVNSSIICRPISSAMGNNGCRGPSPKGMRCLYASSAMLCTLLAKSTVLPKQCVSLLALACGPKFVQLPLVVQLFV